MKRLVYAEEAKINSINEITGVFSVISETNEQLYNVHFESSKDKNIPSCECMDWQRNYLPCKHMLAIIQSSSEWGWGNLPVEYRESPYLTLDSDIIFKPVNHIEDEIQDQSMDNSYPPTPCLHEAEPGPEMHGNSTVTAELPKPVFPKRTSVTRCCDLLSSIKNLVHECTSVPALNNLEKVLASALKDLEAESDSVSGLTLSALDRPSNSKRKRKTEQPKSTPATKSKKRKVTKSKLPSVQLQKKHPYNKRVGQHAQMMKKFYKTDMTLHDMMATQATTYDISPVDGTNH